MMGVCRYLLMLCCLFGSVVSVRNVVERVKTPCSFAKFIESAVNSSGYISDLSLLTCIAGYRNYRLDHMMKDANRVDLFGVFGWKETGDGYCNKEYFRTTISKGKGPSSDLHCLYESVLNDSNNREMYERLCKDDLTNLIDCKYNVLTKKVRMPKYKTLIVRTYGDEGRIAEYLLQQKIDYCKPPEAVVKIKSTYCGFAPSRYASESSAYYYASSTTDSTTSSASRSSFQKYEAAETISTFLKETHPSAGNFSSVNSFSSTDSTTSTARPFDTARVFFTPKLYRTSEPNKIFHETKLSVYKLLSSYTTSTYNSHISASSRQFLEPSESSSSKLYNKPNFIFLGTDFWISVAVIIVLICIGALLFKLSEKVLHRRPHNPYTDLHPRMANQNIYSTRDELSLIGAEQDLPSRYSVYFSYRDHSLGLRNHSFTTDIIYSSTSSP